MNFRRVLILCVALAVVLSAATYSRMATATTTARKPANAFDGDRFAGLNLNIQTALAQNQDLVKELAALRKDIRALQHRLDHAESAASSATTTTASAGPESPRPAVPENPPVVRVHPAHPVPEPASARVVCEQLVAQFKIIVGSSWGNAPHEEQARWRKLHCDDELTARPSSVFSPDASGGAPVAVSGDTPTIAVCLCVTTRGLKGINSPTDLALTTIMLPSFARTASPGYRYFVYLGYDFGDAFFDDAGKRSELERWFVDNVASALRPRGISAELRLIGFANKERKPGPCFNFVTNFAYQDRAANVSYFYRINDDSEMASPWADVFRKQLDAMGPPYGVVGPTCHQGNSEILTHDFVHRTHMDIFAPTYYPPVLSDWYMDDWSTRVYGRDRTRRVNEVHLHHHIHSHGTRYEVDESHKMKLQSEIDGGHAKILQYMIAKNLPSEAVERFRNDRTDHRVDLDGFR